MTQATLTERIVRREQAIIAFGLVIITALPGVAPEAVRAEVEDGTLIISGTRSLPKGRIVRLEIPYGRFERHIALPNRLQLAAHELKNGCLVLTFTKAG